MCFSPLAPPEEFPRRTSLLILSLRDSLSSPILGVVPPESEDVHLGEAQLMEHPAGGAQGVNGVGVEAHDER